VQLIPSIDLRAGACVRLLKGDFAAETRYDTDVPALLAHYRALGANWLHIVDLDGARDGQLGNLPLIRTLAAQPERGARTLRLQVGGGVRSEQIIDGLLEHGVARVVIGSAAAERREQARGWLQRFGAERICFAFDVRLDAQGVPRLSTRGWQQRTQLILWDAVAAFEDSGLRHVLCTDIERDGALSGPNLALYTEALRRFPHLQWQASGGIASGADLQALSRLGVAAAISGKALLEERISFEELRLFLPSA
jgi:phosphoribosylformimino-5-aminoimidazole carboxamide ribotide isomerase